MEKYRDEIAMLCHETMKDGYKLGLVSDSEMEEFEKNCFVSVPEPVKEEEIAAMIANYWKMKKQHLKELLSYAVTHRS